MGAIDLAYLRHLAIFCLVVDSGSFASAARRLHSSRSRVSEQVSELENILGMRLLQRSTRQLTLTDEGEQVYTRAKILQQTLDDIDSLSANETPRGRVAITMTHDVAHKFILPAIQGFLRQYPEIYIDFVLKEEVADLINEKIDLAIRVSVPKDTSLVARVLHEERLQLYANPDFLAALPSPVSIDNLNEMTFLTLDIPLRNTNQRLYNGSVSAVLAPQNTHKCNSPFLIQKMAAAGMGLALFFPSTVKQEVANGELVPVLPQWHSETATYALVYPSRKNIPQRTRLLIEYLVNARLFG